MKETLCSLHDLNHREVFQEPPRKLFSILKYINILLDSI